MRNYSIKKKYVFEETVFIQYRVDAVPKVIGVWHVKNLKTDIITVEPPY